MPITLVSPMNDAATEGTASAPRLASLRGRTVALLDISKPGGSVFFDRLEHLLTARFGVAKIIRDRKLTYTKPAPADVLERLRHMDAVVEGLAD